MSAIGCHRNATLPLLSLLFASTSLASLAIRNYDQDPDLAAALQYDRGETTDRSKADRELAEKYYLEYLKKEIPSFQKARVYLRLGALYTVESDPRNGIMSDVAKGTRYLEKVLEQEPERIDPVTIRARTLLASSPGLSREETFRRRLDVYEWLSSLDNEKFKSLWLPLEPGQEAILPITLTQLQNLIPNAKHATETNAVGLAITMPDREAKLAEIIRRFPGTRMEDLARQHLRSQLEEVMDEAVESLPSAGSEPNGGPIAEAEVKSTGQRAGATSVLAEAPPSENVTRTAWTTYPLIACVALAGSLLIYIAWRRKRPEQDRAS